ncbi:MAG: glycosyltransferase family 4 protein [Bifidobacteriaceae bacterium]|nr:glycosyltransferase family 4 protein [Bifidobacteriaceae bacterium]
MATKPHTLVITNDFPPRTGGIEAFAYEMVKRFEPTTVTVLTSAEANASDFDAQQPFQIVRTKRRPLLPTPGTTKQAIDLARQVQASSVWFASAAPLALMANRLRQSTNIERVVATSHGHEVGWVAVPVTRSVVKSLANQVDHLTYIADYTAREIGRVLSPEARRRMVKLSPGVNPERFDSFAAARQVSDAAPSLTANPSPLVLSVSRLVKRKGQDVLIKAWPTVVQHHPGAQLVIVGDGPARRHIERLAKDSPVKSLIQLKGKLDYASAELNQLFTNAQVFAMPCRSRLGRIDFEGYGIVFLEAQAAGLPVIVGKSGGAPEACLPEQTGLLVDARSVTSVSNGIVQLLDDPNLAQQMGRTGREWVLNTGTWQSRFAVLSQLLGRAS